MAESARFVGRDDALGRALAAYESVAAGQGAVLMLSGEAGIGKSSLLRELLRRASERGARVGIGRSFEGPEASYGALAEACAELARGLTGLDVPLGEVASSPLGSSEERLRVFDAVRAFLLSLAQLGPVVLALEDLHWAGGDTLALFTYLVRRLAGERVLFVATHRPLPPEPTQNLALAELLAVLEREPQHTRIALHGMSRAELALLLAAGAQSLPEPLVAAIEREVHGNPFYARELVRHLIESGEIERDAGRWVSSTSLAELGVPEGVRNVVRLRLSRLPAAVMGVLEHAAACVGELRASVLAGALGVSSNQVEQALAHATHAEFLRRTRHGLEFSHAIVQRAVYDTVPDERRARIHRALADAMERVCPDEHAELARHYHASRMLPDAVRGRSHALLAAEAARRRAAHERARTLLTLALALTPARADQQAEVHALLARNAAEAGLLDAARADCEHALEHMRAAGATDEQLAGLLIDVAWALRDAGLDALSAAPLLERALALLPEQSVPWARAQLLFERVPPLATTVFYSGTWLGSDARALTILRSQDDERDVALSYHPLDVRDRADTDQLLTRARRFRHHAAQVRMLDAAARDLLYRHVDLLAARECLSELLRVTERNGSLPGQAEALVQRAICLATLGEAEAALADRARAAALVLRLPDTHRMHVLGTAGMPAILAYLASGDFLEPAERAQKALRDPRMVRLPVGFMLAAIGAWAYVLAGQREPAIPTLRALLPVLEEATPLVTMRGVALDFAAEAVARLELRELVPGYLALCERSLGSSESSAPITCKELGVARLCEVSGDRTRAQTLHARARDVLQARSQHGVLARLAREASTAPVLPGGLTPREVEVLSLLARGLANKEIAARLHLSVATVERHIANVYGKIGVRGRAAAARYAVAQGLVSDDG